MTHEDNLLISLEEVLENYIFEVPQWSHPLQM